MKCSVKHVTDVFGRFLIQVEIEKSHSVPVRPLKTDVARNWLIWPSGETAKLTLEFTELHVIQ